MTQNTRFQMRCDHDFLLNLTRLKKKLGASSRPEVVRIAVSFMLSELKRKDKDEKSS